jgi:hypothetical protein
MIEQRNVRRYGSIFAFAETRCLREVRFPPDNDQIADITIGRRRAMCGRLRVGKENLHVASEGKSPRLSQVVVNDFAKVERPGIGSQAIQQR